MHDSNEIGPFKVVAVFHAESWINVLFGENPNGEHFIAVVQAAFELEIHGFCVVVAENNVFGLDVFHIFLLLLTLLDVAMEIAVLGNRVAPEFTAAAWFLADFEFNAFFLFVFR